MKKIILTTIVLITFFNCKAQQFENEINVLTTLNNEIVKRTALKRVKDYGILFKEYNNYNWVIDFITKDPFKDDRILSKVNDSVTYVFFSKKNKENYISQLKNQDLDFNKLNFDNEKIAVYSDKLDDKLKRSKFVVFNTSLPVFSVDKRKAIVFASSSHEAVIYLFRLELDSESNLEEWKLYKKYNSLFSNLNH